MVSENINKLRWHVDPKFLLEKLHKLLHFANIFVNHALLDMILLRGGLGKITFDVGSRVQELYFTVHTPNKYDKLHNVDFSTFSNLINWKKLLDIVQY